MTTPRVRETDYRRIIYERQSQSCLRIRSEPCTRYMGVYRSKYQHIFQGILQESKIYCVGTNICMKVFQVRPPLDVFVKMIAVAKDAKPNP